MIYYNHFIDLYTKTTAKFQTNICIGGLATFATVSLISIFRFRNKKNQLIAQIKNNLQIKALECIISYNKLKIECGEKLDLAYNNYRSIRILVDCVKYVYNDACRLNNIIYHIIGFGRFPIDEKNIFFEVQIQKCNQKIVNGKLVYRLNSIPFYMSTSEFTVQNMSVQYIMSVILNCIYLLSNSTNTEDISKLLTIFTYETLVNVNETNKLIQRIIGTQFNGYFFDVLYHNFGIQCLLICGNSTDTCIIRVLGKYHNIIERIKNEPVYENKMCVKSRVKFLAVEYSHPELFTPIFLEIPNSHLISGNELFSWTYVCRIIQKYPWFSRPPFDERYELKIIDGMAKEIILTYNQFLRLDERKYEIINIYKENEKIQRRGLLDQHIT